MVQARVLPNCFKKVAFVAFVGKSVEAVVNVAELQRLAPLNTWPCFRLQHDIIPLLFSPDHHYNHSRTPLSSWDTLLGHSPRRRNVHLRPTHNGNNLILRLSRYN